MAEKGQDASKHCTTHPEPSVTPLAESLYTVWAVRQHCLRVCLLGYVAFVSSLTTSIYFPVIDLLSTRYAASPQSKNLTGTLFYV